MPQQIFLIILLCKFHKTSAIKRLTAVLKIVVSPCLQILFSCDLMLLYNNSKKLHYCYINYTKILSDPHNLCFLHHNRDNIFHLLYILRLSNSQGRLYVLHESLSCFKSLNLPPKNDRKKGWTSLKGFLRTRNNKRNMNFLSGSKGENSFLQPCFLYSCTFQNYKPEFFIKYISKG